MTFPINRFPRTPPSSSNRRKLLLLLIQLLINVATILSQTSDAPPGGSTTVEHVTDASGAAETPAAKSASSSSYRQTIYTHFADVYATQLPLATVSEATMLKCCLLCLYMPFCSGFNYLRSPSDSSGSCDPKADPKDTTCEFLAFESITNVQFATSTMPLCRTLYASETSTNQGRSGLNWCLSAPCQNSGTCVAVTDTYFCNCTKSTTGRNCETVLGYDCATNSPCVPGGDQYFPVDDTTKYIQCGAAQNCFTQTCAGGLHWDQSQQICR